MPARSHHPSCVLVPLAAALLLSATALAQVGHPSAGRPRAVHERLDAADRVVRVRIGAVSEGRIAVTEATALVGQAEAPFEIKRSPLRPHPLAEGDRAILFLRGARPPYVLVDEPGEVIRLVDPEAHRNGERRWSEAIQALAATREASAKLAETYLDWIDGGPGSLRSLGANGVIAVIEQDAALAAGVGAERVPHAVDPVAVIEARRISAQLAAASPVSAGALCEVVAHSATPLDAALTEITLRACGGVRSPAAVTLLERAATHQDAALRGAAARSLALIAAGAPAPTLAIAKRLAENDPDNAVRRAAERMLRNASRPHPRKRREPAVEPAKAH